MGNKYGCKTNNKYKMANNEMILKINTSNYSRHIEGLLQLKVKA